VRGPQRRDLPTGAPGCEMAVGDNRVALLLERRWPQVKAVRCVVVLVWMGCLAYLSLGRTYPDPIEGALAFTGTTSLHFGGYAVLAALLGWAWGRRTRRLLAVAGAFAYGAVLEALQLLVPGRTAAWDDLGVNLAGAVTGTLILVLAIRVARWARPSRED